MRWHPWGFWRKSLGNRIFSLLVCDEQRVTESVAVDRIFSLLILNMGEFGTSCYSFRVLLQKWNSL